MGKGSCTRAGLTPIPFEKKRIERKRKELEEREEVEGASKSFLDVLFIKFHSCVIHFAQFAVWFNAYSNFIDVFFFKFFFNHRYVA